MVRLVSLAAGLALAAALAAGAAGCQQARPTPEEWLLTVEQQVEMGRACAPVLERRLGGRLDAPAVQAYVRSVGERVARATAMSGWPYRFSVLDSRRAEAFSLPGGPVYVTRGLLERLRSEGELAAVLGHQLAHGGAGHDEQRISLLLRSLGLMQEALAAAFAGSGSAGPRSAGSIEKVVGAWIGMPYTPEMEIAADRLGLDYIVAAGYDPDEMAGLASLCSGSRGPQPMELTQIHPNPPDRASEVRDAISRKYAGRRGRVGRQEYQREVLDRLNTDVPRPGGPGG